MELLARLYVHQYSIYMYIGIKHQLMKLRPHITKKKKKITNNTNNNMKYRLYHQTTPKPTSPNIRAKAASLGLDPSAAIPVLAPLVELGCVGPFPSLP